MGPAPVDVEAMVAGVRERRPAWVARAITLVESTRPDHQAQAQDFADQAYADLYYGSHYATRVYDDNPESTNAYYAAYYAWYAAYDIDYNGDYDAAACDGYYACWYAWYAYQELGTDDAWYAQYYLNFGYLEAWIVYAGD